MAVPSLLDLAAMLSEIVGALVGVLALVRDVLDKGRRESRPEPGLESSAPIPRGWLRVSLGLCCMPPAVLGVAGGNFAPAALRTSVDAVAAAAGLAALLAFGMHVLRIADSDCRCPTAFWPCWTGSGTCPGKAPSQFSRASAARQVPDANYVITVRQTLGPGSCLGVKLL
jgi:hypothetical protein